MFYQNLAFVFPSFDSLAKKMLLVSHKVIIIENEATVLCVTVWGGICSYSLVYNFLI